ncbi:hypothetical protein [Gordonia metallireducens]|uniref:hypothetical protein n=1 Tax=Gordonia metallireducens TaxID=2897779 RepID=UPI001E2C2B4C|nr:hypothetical protein [Gordonia metallireducens]
MPSGTSSYGSFSRDGSTIRTEAVADRAMTDRIGRTHYLNQRLVWVVLIPALCIVPGVSLVVGEIDEPATVVLAYVLLGVVGGLVMLAVLTWVLLYQTGPREWALKIPEGTQVSAEFGPHEISFGWVGARSTLPASGVRWVKHRTRTATTTIAGMGTTLIIPNELVPLEVRDHLLARFDPRPPLLGRRRTTAPPPSSISYSAHRTVVRDGGTVHISCVADDGLPDRLQRSLRRGPVVPATFAAVLVPLVALLYFGAYVVAVILAAALVLLAVLFFTPFAGRWWFRRTVAPGTTISAEYGPDRIRLRLGAYDRTIDRTSIHRVKRVGTALQVSPRTATDVLLIPDELVLPDIAEELLAEFGRRPGWRRLVDALRR